MEINIEELYKLQAELDLDIANRHNVTYESSFKKRLLALIVELGEFANETRCFKYWSLKPSSPKEVVLEEYVDGLHFILSLGVYLKPRKFIYQLNKLNYNLEEAILITYKSCLDLYTKYDLESYEIAMTNFLNLITYLDVTVDEVIKSYLSKLDVNYKRQENKY